MRDDRQYDRPTGNALLTIEACVLALLMIVSAASGIVSLID